MMTAADPISRVDLKEHVLVLYMLLGRNIEALREQVMSDPEGGENLLASSSSDDDEDLNQILNRIERLVVLAVGKLPQAETQRQAGATAKSLPVKVVKVPYPSYQPVLAYTHVSHSGRLVDARIRSGDRPNPVRLLERARAGLPILLLVLLVAQEWHTCAAIPCPQARV